MPNLAMAEQGPVATFNPPEVPQGAVVDNGYLRHLGGRECNRKV